MKILMTDACRRFYYKDADLHTQYGYVKKDIIEKAKPGKKVLTNTGKEMTVIDAGFMDMYAKIKRMAQIIPLKDIGKVIAETGVNHKSVVLDSGTGSAATCCFLAHIVKKVYTYEIREDFAKLCKKNIDMLGMKNVKLKVQDIYEGIDEKKLDMILLDLPEPWKVIQHAFKALKVGGYLVSYSPTLPQVSDFVEEARKTFTVLKTTETIEREWEIEGRKIRPRSQAIGHSGFLTVVRKV